jgi:hypothetical protein
MRGRYRSGFVGSGSLRIWNREKANEVGDGFPERAEIVQRARAHARTLLTRTNAHTDATQARARAATTAGWNTRPPYNIATHKMQRTRCNAQPVRWRTRKGRDRPPRLAEHGPSASSYRCGGAQVRCGRQAGAGPAMSLAASVRAQEPARLPSAGGRRGVGVAL